MRSEGAGPLRRPGASDRGLAGEVCEDPPANLGAAGCLQLVMSEVDPMLLTDVAAARRSVRHEREIGVLDGWSAFLAGQYPEGATFATLSYGPDCEWPPYTPRAVFKDAHRFMKKVGIGRPFFLVAERHKYRDVLHGHGLLPPMEQERRLSLMASWEQGRGYARLLPATAGAFPYVCKYALKGSERRLEERRPVTRHTPGADWVDLSGLRRS